MEMLREEHGHVGNVDTGIPGKKVILVGDESALISTLSVLDRFDIAGGTAGAGAWAVITYQPSLQTFATGAGSDWDGGTPNIYIAKEGTAAIPQRIFCFSVVNNTMKPVTSDWYLGGAALLGNKIWIRSLSSANLIKWLYILQSTSTNLRRIMIF
jgi:hypothetical protein